MKPPEGYGLTSAYDTDEIFKQALRLAGWAMRNGMPEHEVLDWVLEQPREEILQRGSRSDKTAHHVTQGVKLAIESFDPNVAAGSDFDPEMLHELASRIAGSGTKHERYLLGVVALCHKYRTFTPVITGVNLGEVVGTSRQAAADVLRAWSKSRADGFFTKVTYDGTPGHGRVWWVDVDWQPVGLPVHEPGCNRAKSRCKCRKTLYLSDSAVKIGKAKCDTQEWLNSLEWQQPVTAAEAATALGLTKAAAAKLLDSERGKTFESAVVEAGTRRTATGVTRTPRTWFVADRWQRWPDGAPPEFDN